MSGSAQFELAIIIPIYKHSVLLSEAVHSALQQNLSVSSCIILVDDGCPFFETQAICRSFALTKKNIFYLRKSNGGLSSARNFGLDFARQLSPRIKWFFFLDADNRLTENALEDAIVFARNHPQADWIYPSLNSFGVQAAMSCAGAYAPLNHVLWNNMCDAGSLISSKIFEAGIRYDEDMVNGFEDWDFWLQCLSAGFKGANHDTFGLDYRRRPASMLTSSLLNYSATVSYLRSKHRNLSRPATLLEMESADSPRYAVVEAESGGVLYFTDPRQNNLRSADIKSYCLRHIGSRIEPDSVGVPPYICWMRASDFDALREAKIVNALFHFAELLCKAHQQIRIVVNMSGRGYSLSSTPASSSHDSDTFPVIGWFMHQSVLGRREQLGPDRSTPQTVASCHNGAVADLILEVPRELVSAGLEGNMAARAKDQTLESMAELQASVRGRRWSWKNKWLPNSSENYLTIRQHLKCNAAGNWLKNPAGRDVGVVVPSKCPELVVKKLAALVQEIRGFDVRVHLIADGCFNDPNERGVVLGFESIRFIPEFQADDTDFRLYNGHQVASPEVASAYSKDVVGCLFDLDIIIHPSCDPFYYISAVISEWGAKMVSYVPPRCAAASSYELSCLRSALSYEHTHSFFLVESEQTRSRLHLMGVPDGKLLPVSRSSQILF